MNLIIDTGGMLPPGEKIVLTSNGKLVVGKDVTPGELEEAARLFNDAATRIREETANHPRQGRAGVLRR